MRSEERRVGKDCRKLAAARPLKDIRDEYNYPKKKGIKDECSRLLEDSTMKSRRGFAIQRFFFEQKTAYDVGLGIPAEPLFRSERAKHIKPLLLIQRVSF